MRTRIPSGRGRDGTGELANEDFRRLLFTGKHLQLVLMCIEPGGEIGTEVHGHVDQFFRVEEGTAVFVLNGRKHKVRDGGAAVVPAGTRHNVVNASKREPLRLYTVYAPPEPPAANGPEDPGRRRSGGAREDVAAR